MACIVFCVLGQFPTVPSTYIYNFVTRNKTIDEDILSEAYDPVASWVEPSPVVVPPTHNLHSIDEASMTLIQCSDIGFYARTLHLYLSVVISKGSVRFKDTIGA